MRWGYKKEHHNKNFKEGREERISRSRPASAAKGPERHGVPLKGLYDGR